MTLMALIDRNTLTQVLCDLRKLSSEALREIKASFLLSNESSSSLTATLTKSDLLIQAQFELATKHAFQSSQSQDNGIQRMQRTDQVPTAYDYLAPDSTQIRLLPLVTQGEFVHYTLPAGKVSAPVKHKTVEELWHVLEGSGEIWLKEKEQERIIPLSMGSIIRIPPATPFQLRNQGEAPLKTLIVTMPLWPSQDEAVATSGH